MARYLFTEKGHERLQKLVEKTGRKLLQVTKEKAEAGSGQDTWHDEGFKLGTAEEMMWSKRLGDLQDLISNAQIVEPEEQSRCVRIGTGVEIEYEDGSTRKLILEGYIVGETKNRVSIYSPLGKLLLGAEAGEERNLELGKNNKRVITVKKIFPPSIAENVFQNE